VSPSGLVTGTPTREDGLPPGSDATSIIAAAFAPLAGKRLLDIGCGVGVLARSLSDRRAHVAGVDPNAEALALAREAVPTGTFHAAGAETLPFADDSFDGGSSSTPSITSPSPLCTRPSKRRPAS
jgi:2-polyprenyl-3-methyl-5-hydroxy-6-metoxy-1,4-benzoquinol methylase